MATSVHNARVAIGALTPGTAVKLLATGSQEVNWVCISAPFMNKGVIFIGNSSVSGYGSTTADTDGYMLMPGKEVRLGGCDLADVYIDGKGSDCVYYVAASTDT